MKNGKALGGSGILPEMLKVGKACSDFVATLVGFLGVVWREGLALYDWRDAILVPVPKKRNLHCCNSLRDISLLDVVGKLLGKIVQNCLQKPAKRRYCLSHNVDLGRDASSPI